MQKSVSYTDKLVRLFNVCLVGLVAVYLFGQTLPLTSQLLSGAKVNFSPKDYEQYSSPLLLAAVILTALLPLARDKDNHPLRFKRTLIGLALVSALCPIAVLFFAPFKVGTMIGFWAAAFLLCSWLFALGRDFLLPLLLKGKNKTKRKKSTHFASLCIHLGFAILAVGIMGVETLSSSYDVNLDIGSQITLADHTFSALSQQNYVTDSGIVRFDVGMSMAGPGGTQRALLPFIEHYPKLGTLHMQPAIAAGFLQDVQVVLSEVPDIQDIIATLHITFFPLMSWIWAGGALMAFGGILTFIPKKD